MPSCTFKVQGKDFNLAYNWQHEVQLSHDRTAFYGGGSGALIRALNRQNQHS